MMACAPLTVLLCIAAMLLREAQGVITRAARQSAEAEEQHQHFRQQLAAAGNWSNTTVLQHHQEQKRRQLQDRNVPCGNFFKWCKDCTNSPCECETESPVSKADTPLQCHPKLFELVQTCETFVYCKECKDDNGPESPMPHCLCTDISKGTESGDKEVSKPEDCGENGQTLSDVLGLQVLGINSVSITMAAQEKHMEAICEESPDCILYDVQVWHEQLEVYVFYSWRVGAPGSGWTLYFKNLSKPIWFGRDYWPYRKGIPSSLSSEECQKECIADDECVGLQFTNHPSPTCGFFKNVNEGFRTVKTLPSDTDPWRGAVWANASKL